jgi:hypothetical protein
MLSRKLANSLNQKEDIKMKKILAVLLVAGMFLVATAAMAIPINGTLGFNGTTKFTPGGSTLLSATGLTDMHATVSAEGSDGIYENIPDLTNVTFTNFTFTSSTPVDSLWTVTFAGITYSFDLLEIVATRETLSQNQTSLDLVGSGILKATGYDDTAGIWTFSSVANNERTTGRFNFSANSDPPPPVPEPGTIFLLGSGLLGLGFYGRRRKKC